MDAELKGPTEQMTWSQAMDWTHHDDRGFSHTEQAQDHFVTSIGIGDHVARVVLGRCQAAAMRHGIQDPWIVDVGAGDGRLLRQLLDLGFPADRLLGVDVRPAPEDLPVKWIRGIAPDCVPAVRGVLLAHEFLDDIAVEVVDGEYVLTTAGAPARSLTPDERLWLRTRTSSRSPVLGLRRDEVWAALVGKVSAGEAIAVDFMGGPPVGHRRGRRMPPRVSAGADLCAGVDLRACRALTGGRLVPQHRVLAQCVPRSTAQAAELRVLRDRAGLGSFGWLFTDRSSVGSPA